MTSHIYVGAIGEHATTFVDFDVDAQAPADRARRLLTEHPSCERVEVWRDDNRIAVVTRSDLGPET